MVFLIVVLCLSTKFDYVGGLLRICYFSVFFLTSVHAWLNAPLSSISKPFAASFP